MKLKLRSDKSFRDFLKSNGNLFRVGLILVFGIVLILIGSISDGKRTESVDADGLESRLADMCSDIEGVGECRVMITYDDGGDVYAVAVLCDGGDSATVRARVTDFIGSLFGIGSNRISVLKIT